MADIVLSFQKTDLERVAPIVALLKSYNWSIWSDRSVNAGEQWDEVFEREIGSAGCLIAVWSARSANSHWVHAEASEGFDRGILLPVLIDAVKPPREFWLVEPVNLVGWRGRASDPAARSLVAAIGRLVGSAASARTFDGEPLLEEEEEHWQMIRKGRDPRLLCDFLATYPNGRYARAAEARLGQLALRHEPVGGSLRAGLPAVLLHTGGAGRSAWAWPSCLVAGALSVVMAVTIRSSGWLLERPPTPPPPVVEVKVEIAGTRDRLVQAKRLIEGGDIPGARDVLAAAATSAAPSGAATFMLAETYDPNMLASWHAQGIAANPERARALYRKALDLGDSRALRRLEWLSATQ